MGIGDDERRRRGAAETRVTRSVEVERMLHRLEGLKEGKRQRRGRNIKNKFCLKNSLKKPNYLSASKNKKEKRKKRKKLTVCSKGFSKSS